LHVKAAHAQELFEFPNLRNLGVIKLGFAAIVVDQ
jgi:hypothetical protein